MQWLILFALWAVIGGLLLLALGDIIPTWLRHRRAWRDLDRAIQNKDYDLAYDAALRTENPAMIRAAKLVVLTQALAQKSETVRARAVADLLIDETM